MEGLKSGCYPESNKVRISQIGLGANRVEDHKMISDSYTNIIG